MQWLREPAQVTRFGLDPARIGGVIKAGRPTGSSGWGDIARWAESRSA